MEWTQTKHKLARRVLEAPSGTVTVQDGEFEAAREMLDEGSLFLDTTSSEEELVVRRGTITADASLTTDLVDAIVVHESFPQTKQEVKVASRKSNGRKSNGKAPRKARAAKQTVIPGTEKPKRAAAKGAGVCGCGCGASVPRLFKQGHDQRLKGSLSRIAAGKGAAEDHDAAKKAAKIEALRSRSTFSALFSAAGL